MPGAERGWSTAQRFLVVGSSFGFALVIGISCILMRSWECCGGSISDDKRADVAGDARGGVAGIKQHPFPSANKRTVEPPPAPRVHARVRRRVLPVLPLSASTPSTAHQGSNIEGDITPTDSRASTLSEQEAPQAGGEEGVQSVQGLVAPVPVTVDPTVTADDQKERRALLDRRRKESGRRAERPRERRVSSERVATAESHAACKARGKAVASTDLKVEDATDAE